MVNNTGATILRFSNRILGFPYYGNTVHWTVNRNRVARVLFTITQMIFYIWSRKIRLLFLKSAPQAKFLKKNVDVDCWLYCYKNIFAL